MADDDRTLCAFKSPHPHPLLAKVIPLRILWTLLLSRNHFVHFTSAAALLLSCPFQVDLPPRLGTSSRALNAKPLHLLFRNYEKRRAAPLENAKRIMFAGVEEEKVVCNCQSSRKKRTRSLDISLSGPHVEWLTRW